MYLEQLIEDEDCQTLQKNEKQIAEYIDHEVQEKSTKPETYLIYKISKCQNKTAGIIMFQTLKRSCDKYSRYTWVELMKVLGSPMMFGAVISQNIKLLEHTMSHVDEIYLERLLYDVEAPKIVKWYDENFVLT